MVQARILRWSLFLFAAFVGAVLAALLWQYRADAADRARFPLPGRLVDVGGYRLHLLCKGRGPGPTVVMVAGGGTPSVVSYPLQDRIAKFAPVCSYDRAGLGWSDPAPHALSFDDQARDLERVLTRGHVPGPYLFVPESFGSLIVIRFADLHPRQIAGAVFLDGVDPKLWFPAMKTQAGFGADANNVLMQAAWRLGLVRLAYPRLAPAWVHDLPVRIRREMAAIYSRAAPGYAEALRAYEVSAPARRPHLVPGALGTRPVVVITHGEPSAALSAAFQQGWAASQARLARWSRRSESVMARHADHEVAQEVPDLAAQWVRRAWQAAPDAPRS